MNKSWVAWWLLRHVSNYQKCFSTIIRTIFWGVGAVFKNIKPWFMKKFISLFMISSILQQYLLNVSSLPPLNLQSVSTSSFCLRPPCEYLWSVAKQVDCQLARKLVKIFRATWLLFCVTIGFYLNKDAKWLPSCFSKGRSKKHPEGEGPSLESRFLQQPGN